MNLHEHFLESDLGQASRQFKCVKDVLTKIHVLIANGDVEKAKHYSIDLTRSLHELSRLADEKKELDKVNKLVSMMGASGINLQVIRKLHHE